jgi:hypothetical protein
MLLDLLVELNYNKSFKIKYNILNNQELIKDNRIKLRMII